MVVIFVIRLITSAEEDLYGLLTAVKYPFKLMVTEVKGSETAIKYSALTEILLCKNVFNIIGANKKRIVEEISPNEMLNNKHFFIAILAPVSEFIANSSETNLVVARLIP